MIRNGGFYLPKHLLSIKFWFYKFLPLLILIASFASFSCPSWGKWFLLVQKTFPTSDQSCCFSLHLCLSYSIVLVWWSESHVHVGAHGMTHRLAMTFLVVSLLLSKLIWTFSLLFKQWWWIAGWANIPFSVSLCEGLLSTRCKMDDQQLSWWTYSRV